MKTPRWSPRLPLCAVLLPCILAIVTHLAAAEAKPAAAEASAAREPQVAPPAFTTAASVRNLPAPEASKEYPVHIRGVITYVNVANGELFVQDNSAGIFVFVRNSRYDQPLEWGQLVEVNGVTAPGDFSSSITKADIKVKGHAPMPKLFRLAPDLLITGAEDSQWGQLKGVVRSGRENNGVLSLNMVAAGGEVLALMKDYPPNWAAQLIDAKVTLSGVLAAAFNEHRQAVGMRIFVPSAKFIHIDDPAAASPFDLPVVSAVSVGAFRENSDESRRIHIRSTVTAAVSTSLVYMSDAEGNLPVEMDHPGSIEPGDFMDVAGFPGLVDGRPGLKNAIWRLIARHRNLPSRHLAASDILTPEGKEDKNAGSGLTIAAGTRYDLSLVSVEGTLLQQSGGLHATTITLSSRDRIFIATIPDSALRAADDLEIGSQLKLTGVCLVNYDEFHRAQSFMLLLRRPGDITVLSRPPWLGLRHALWIVGIMVLSVIAAMTWIAILRKQVAMLSQIRTSEASLRESEERYALATRGSNDGLWDWKLTTNLIYLSPRWFQMLGESGGGEWSDPAEWFGRIHVSDRERVIAEVARHREGNTSELVTEYRMRHRNGGFIWMLTRGIAVRDSGGVAIRMAGSQTDITEGKIGDPLTGLPNRLYLIDRLECAFDDARRTGDLFAVLFVDLDRFKLVNDSLGHASGDELLVGVAGRLRSSVRAAERSADGRRSVVVRHGGDEFAVLLNNVSDEADAAIVAQRVVKELESPFSIAGRQVFATVSVGVAMGSSCNSPEDIVRNADTAMYYAKARGKSRFEVFDEGMRERAVARLETETGLRKAIDEGQLVLFYQPEISVQNHRVVGYEALVRWNHPERGLLSPGEFISIAEESDLIVHLGRWVLKEACSQMARWHKTVGSAPPLTVSVNVSARQLTDSRFVEDVESILAETGLDPWSLKLEVTESSIMGNPEETLETLRRLKAMHIGLEIDDFGTGYSSLSYLQKLPFDTVKVDRSFVRELGANPESLEIVKTIVDLARSLDMRVVAEGVETGDQLEKLIDLGCNCVQGFYFAKPASSQATSAILKERQELEQDFALLQHGAPGGYVDELETLLPDTPEDVETPLASA